MSMPKELCVAYATDDHYARFMGISMLSLFKANHSGRRIHVFLLDYGVKPENRQRLESIAQQYGQQLDFVSVEDQIAKLKLNMGARKISIVSYARLFLGSIIPGQYEKILYLDCDTIIDDDLSMLYDTELGDNLVAGVQDTVDGFYLNVIGLAPDCRYVNAGILLINLAAWRQEDMESRFMAFIEKFSGNVPHHDQGVINGVCGARRVILPLKCNVTTNIYSFTPKMIKRMYFLSSFYSQAEVDEARQKPTILHFTTGLLGRPWEQNCQHPQKEKYTAIANESPWRDTPLDPDTMKKSVKLAAFAIRCMPNGLFAELYRSSCWIMHQRK